MADNSVLPEYRPWQGQRNRQAIKSPNRRATRAKARAPRDIAPDGEAPVTLGAIPDHPNWVDNFDLAGTLGPILPRLCTTYLLRENTDAGTTDPVAHFHLTNGARIERINWLADRSSKGVGQSAGMMINYVYKLAAIELNHEAYRGEGKIPASSAVRALL